MPLAALTPGDLRRIARATGLAPARFTARRAMDGAERAEIQASDPALGRLVARPGPVVSLAVRAGACVFHGPAGCTLPARARPLLCRRFPLVRARGRLRVEPGGDCLACEEAPDLPSLLALLGLTEAALARLDRRLRDDLRDR